MNIIRFVFLLVTLVEFSFPPGTGSAHRFDEADEAIKSFLASQKGGGEDAQSSGSAVADLNGDGKQEIVLVWTLLGPTYWRNSLTVFTKSTRGFKPAATLQLEGEASLGSVKGGVILVKQKVYAKNDPNCCPSLDKQGRYRWAGNKITEVKK
jgi:hypothetical protein